MSLSISELEAAIDRLYQGPIAEFTQARNALAAECKAGGDKDGAARVKELTKPSAVAWAVNQLFWRDRERFDALALAMAELAATQREALGEVEPSAQGRDARKVERLQAAARAAERRLVASGAAGGPAVVQRLSATLEAMATPRPPGTTAPTPGGSSRSSSRPGSTSPSVSAGWTCRPCLRAPREARSPSPRAWRRAAARKDSCSKTSAARRTSVAPSASGSSRRSSRSRACAARRAPPSARWSRRSRARPPPRPTSRSSRQRLAKARAQAEEKAAAEDDARRALAQSRAELAAAQAAMDTLGRPRKKEEKP